jgi:hypothetical protein
MNNQNQSHPPSHLGRVFRKFFLSAFVVGSFVLYALHKPFAGADPAANLPAPAPDPLNTQVFSPTAPPPVPESGLPQAALAPTLTLPPVEPSATPRQQRVIPTPLPPTPTTPAIKGAYKDGTYTGPQVNAFYGLVQVQTIIQNGKIKSVQFFSSLRIAGLQRASIPSRFLTSSRRRFRLKAPMWILLPEPPSPVRRSFALWVRPSTKLAVKNEADSSDHGHAGHPGGCRS